MTMRSVHEEEVSNMCVGSLSPVVIQIVMLCYQLHFLQKLI